MDKAMALATRLANGQQSDSLDESIGEQNSA